MAELQAKVTAHLNQPAVATRIALQNEVFDRQCRAQASSGTDKTFTLGDGILFKNYAEVIPGVRRFELPTLAALQAAHDQGVCDEVISLNKECFVEAFDQDADGTLNLSEEKIAREKLIQYGVSSAMRDELIAFYQKGGAICLSPQKNPWHRVLPAREPEVDIATILKASELVFEARKNGKSVCFHCNYGKHRTGMLAMVVEATHQTDADLGRIYRRYFDHAWYKGCDSRVQTTEVFSLIFPGLHK